MPEGRGITAMDGKKNSNQALKKQLLYPKTKHDNY